MDSKDVLSLIGSKFYRYDDNDNLEMIRVINMQNVESVKIKDLNTGEMKKVNPKVLSSYKMLNPDGLIMFSIVNVDAGNGTTMNDVIVALYNAKKLREEASTTPYCVCRQNVNDIFYDMNCPNSGVVYAGLCMSEDTCPAHIDYKIMTACQGMEYCYGVNVYIDDTLDDIMECVKLQKFDHVLESIYEQYLKAYTSNPLISRVDKLDHKSLHGYCTSLRILLEENNFMYDFNTCFGITPLGFELSYADEERTILDDKCRQALSYLFRDNMTSTIVLPYAKDIDLDNIQGQYAVVREPSNKLYVIGYTVDGEYVESEEAEEAMSWMHGVALAHSGEDKYNK